MPVTAAQVQAAILGRTGDVDPTTGDAWFGPGGYLAAIVGSVWGEYADKAYVAPRLQELYVERDLYDRMLSLIQQKFDFRDSDATFSRSQRVQRLVDRRATVQDKIDRLERLVAANRAPAVGLITAVAPVSAPYAGVLDANSRRYGGDPYIPRRWNYP